jgi:ParB family chromosome partitioning protein
MAKPALGRGLGALLGGVPPAGKPMPAPPQADPGNSPATAPAENGGRVERVPLSHIRPCPFQPRKDFPDAALRELADSISQQGIVQPLIVRARADHYELIAGERRWRAAQLAGLAEVPVVVRAVEDTVALELALIENLQRENLNPLEEAHGYQELLDQCNLRQEEVAARVGKNRVSVANILRLLRLPPEVQAHLRTGQLSVGHAKVILALSGSEEQVLAANRVIRDGLNVRQTEELIARWQGRAEAVAAPPSSPGKPALARDVHVTALESRLQERLGTKVNLRYRQGKGALEIRFFSDEDLGRILQVVGVTLD